MHSKEEKHIDNTIAVMTNKLCKMVRNTREDQRKETGDCTLGSFALAKACRRQGNIYRNTGESRQECT